MIDTATTEEIERLLALFPVKVLRDEWEHIRGTKDEFCREIARSYGTDVILQFVFRNFLRCKQHVYVFEAPGMNSLPETIPGGGIREYYDESQAIYLSRLTHHVFLWDPVEEAEISFLWPVHIRLKNGYLVVRFVTLEKNLRAYLGRQYSSRSRSVKEEDILANLSSTYGLEISDLHAGVKALWESEFFDAFRAQFKKPHSTTTENMDEEMGIRAHNPQLYQLIHDAELFRVYFRIAGRDGVDPCVASVLVEPSKGHLCFTSYSEIGDEDTGFVVDEIIRLN